MNALHREAALLSPAPASGVPAFSDSARLARLLAQQADHDGHAADPQAAAAATLQQLVAEQLDRLPQPGGGATLQRWQALAQVASHDLSLAKLYEGHTDALAILQELAPPGHDIHDNPPAPDNAVHTTDGRATWGVWAAEAPGGRVSLRDAPDGGVLLEGRKCWCSGAATASHALLTAWAPGAAAPQLVRVALGQPGVEVFRGAWQAVGMAGSASLDVQFSAARAERVGGPGDYLTRPGFWQGGGGIAACWYGGAWALAQALRRTLQAATPESRGPLRLAALGKVDLALRSAAATLREAAAWIDQHPHHDASEVALRARLAAENAAGRVLDEVGRALGATPFCRDAHFARMAADLPVFVRQSHAERDLAALAERVLSGDEGSWAL